MNGGEKIARAAYGGGRLTQSRRTLIDAVGAIRGAFTVDDLVASAAGSSSGPVPPATAYRAVAAMETAGFIERVGERAGSALYIRCDTASHHHHIVCDGCGTTAPADCPVDVAGSAAETGFRITRHEITLYGLCPRCLKKDS